MTWILVCVFLFVFISTLSFCRHITQENALIGQRLKKYTLRQLPKEKRVDDELNKPLSERVFRPLIAAVSSVTERLIPVKNRNKLQDMLQIAGNPGNLKANEFIAVQYIFILATTACCWLLLWAGRRTLFEQVFFSGAVGLIAVLAGKSFLSGRIRKRKDQIQKELPGILDLLCVSVEAGLGFDAALQQVVQKSKGVLAKELAVTLRELQMGKSRADALRDLGKRTETDDLLIFVSAMIQADQLGVPITKILRTQAEQVRLKRRQRVEEKAMKAPIKMLFPLVFFIFPSIFIVLLGPAAINIYDMLVRGFAGP